MLLSASNSSSSEDAQMSVECGYISVTLWHMILIACGDEIDAEAEHRYSKLRDIYRQHLSAWGERIEDDEDILKDGRTPLSEICRSEKHKVVLEEFYRLISQEEINKAEANLKAKKSLNEGECF